MIFTKDSTTSRSSLRSGHRSCLPSARGMFSARRIILEMPRPSAGTAYSAAMLCAATLLVAGCGGGSSLISEDPGLEVRALWQERQDRPTFVAAQGGLPPEV